MAEREIYCSGCQLYLGTIQKARLRKKISHLCENCETIRYQNVSDKPKSPYEDILRKDNPFGFGDDIFGSIFGKKF